MSGIPEVLSNDLIIHRITTLNKITEHKAAIAALRRHLKQLDKLISTHQDLEKYLNNCSGVNQECKDKMEKDKEPDFR